MGHLYTYTHLPSLFAPRSALYSTHRGNYNRGGMLTTAADFFGILNNGMRGGERRFFTYVLCEDSLRYGQSYSVKVLRAQDPQSIRFEPRRVLEFPGVLLSQLGCVPEGAPYTLGSLAL